MNFDCVLDFDGNGLALAMLNNKCYIVDQNKNVLVKDWVDHFIILKKYFEGYYLLKQNKKYNLLHKSGVLVFKEWVPKEKFNLIYGCLKAV